MLQRRHETNQKLGRTKGMNCVILAIVAILAVLTHFANIYLQEKIKIHPQLSTGDSLTKQRTKGDIKEELKEI